MNTPDFDVRLARALADGSACVECQSEFVKAHGYPVLCRYCFRRLTPNQREGAKLATHLEVDVAYHQARARHERKRRV